MTATLKSVSAFISATSSFVGGRPVILLLQPSGWMMCTLVSLALVTAVDMEFVGMETVNVTRDIMVGL